MTIFLLLCLQIYCFLPISIEVKPRTCKNLMLPKVCSISDDCLNLKCVISFAGKRAAMEFVLSKQCNPLSLTASIQVPAARVNWRYKLVSGKLVQLPGFGFKKGAINGGVFVKVVLQPAGEEMKLKVYVSIVHFL